MRKDNQARRQGQTLVEFAITLPVLLVLMFGIVEFGRIFQAWVSIQNAAREAARYASTNQYSERYDNFIKLNRVDDGNSIIPCQLDDAGVVTDPNPVVAGQASPEVIEYINTPERIFATWYQGRDCNPIRESDQDLRRDLLRIASIYETAYLATVGRPELPALTVQPIGILDIGVASLPNPGEEGYTAASNAAAAEAERDLRNFLWSNFNPDYPQYRPTALGLPDGQSGFPDTEADLRSYFNVMMCSNRPFLYADSQPLYPEYGNQRFIEVVDPPPADVILPSDLRTAPVELRNIVAGTSVSPGANVPGCFLNEEPVGQGTEGFNYTINPGIRWLDPGAGGSRVTVVVTYFHPLITPLGMAQFVPISARRSAIVEDFKGAGAAAAFNPLTGDSGSGSDDTIIVDNTATPTEDPDLLIEDTNTPVPTITPTNTVAPREFACTNVILAEADFNETLPEAERKIAFQPYRVIFRIRNDNNTPALVRSAKLNWASVEYTEAVARGEAADPVPDYPGMFFSEFQLNGEVLWEGTDFTPATDTTDPNDGRAINTQNFSIPANSTGVFSAIYENGPQLLNDRLARGAFGDSEFVIVDPLTNNECPLGTVLFESNRTELDEDAPIPDPDAPTDCASENVSFGFGPTAFQDFGWVQLVITNNDPSAPAPISDFEVNWGRWFDEEYGGSVLLQGVYIGGSTPNDGLKIWESLDPAGTPLDVVREGTSLVDDPGEYNPITRADGLWTLGSNTFNLPPRTSRNVWLDLNGGNAASDERKMKQYHFSGTRMIIICPTDGDGGTGGGGNPPVGIVEIDEDPTPNPSATVDLNDRPQANTDNYNFNGLRVHTIDSSNGLLDNDTDCGDDTPNRKIQGSVCSDDTKPNTFTNNGDEPLVVRSCRNGCDTDLGARIVMNSDGSFSYDPTGSARLACELDGIVTDKRNYSIRDDRGATRNGTINITIDLGNGGNKPPDPINNWNSPQTYYYDMRTKTGGSIGSSDNNKVNLKDLFNDPNGDDYDLTSVSNRTGLTVNRSNGAWSYNPWDDSNMVDLTEGETRTVTITITADDGDPLCGESSTRMRIVVTGQAEPPVEEPIDDPTEEDSGTGPIFGGDSD
jgi:VCBS repeat-containing protein